MPRVDYLGCFWIIIIGTIPDDCSIIGSSSLHPGWVRANEAEALALKHN